MEMSKSDTIQMTQRCIEEITMLRRRIDQLEPKAQAYEMIASILRLLPQPTQGAGEDMVRRLKKQIEQLREEPAQEAPDEVNEVQVRAGYDAETMSQMLARRYEEAQKEWLSRKPAVKPAVL